MDFAKKQLEKYGWKEGQGLGKNQDGISNPLKPKLKFDTHGLGHDIAKEIIDPWWARVYDEAAKNITTKKVDDDVMIGTNGESVEITIKKKSKKHKRKKKLVEYDNFIKTSELTKTGEKKLLSDEEEDIDELSDSAKKPKVTSGICEMTDEELLKACGNRTAHKGARHGLKMNAKLARLEAHDKELLETLRTSEINEMDDSEVRRKKKKKSKKNETN